MFVKANELAAVLNESETGKMSVGVYTDTMSAAALGKLLDAEVVDTDSFQPRDGRLVIDCTDAVTDDMDRKREIYAAIDRAALYSGVCTAVFAFRQSYDLGAASNRIINFTMRRRGRPSRVDPEKVINALRGTTPGPLVLANIERGAMTVVGKEFGLTRARVSQIVQDYVASQPKPRKAK
jgi:hypothetical protein